MKSYEVVRHAAENSGLYLSSVCKAMGKADNYISINISRGSTPKADTLADMLGVCGYVLAAIPSDEVPASALIIDGKQSASKDDEERKKLIKEREELEKKLALVNSRLLKDEATGGNPLPPA